MAINKNIKIVSEDGTNRFKIMGIVYFGGLHFTAHGIFEDESVWYHDSQTGSSWTYEKKINEFNVGELEKCQGQQASLVIYTQD